MHPSETTLLALVQGELSGAPLSAVLAHLEHCSDCEMKACEQLRADDEIATLLSLLDHPTPVLQPPVIARPSRAGRLRRAAVAAAVTALGAVATAAALPGTRVHEWLRSRWPAAVQASGPSAGRPAPVSQESIGGITVPVASELTVIFRGPQDTGALTVRVTDRPDATFRSWGGEVAYQVGDGRIAVDNRHPARQYALEIPPTLRRLTVVLGDRIVFQKEGTQLGGGGTPNTAGAYSIPLIDRGGEK